MRMYFQTSASTQHVARAKDLPEAYLYKTLLHLHSVRSPDYASQLRSQPHIEGSLDKATTTYRNPLADMFPLLTCLLRLKTNVLSLAVHAGQ